MTKALSGMYAALLSGFSDEGAFDPLRQKNITEFVLKQGLAGLYVGGSSGESGLMSCDELLAQQEVVKAVTDASPCKLIAHVGVHTTEASILLARNAEKLGYGGLSALPPHSYPFSDGEVLQYYRELATSTDLPVIVYEVPIRTGRPFSLENLNAILAIKNVAGIKFTSTDLFKYALLKKANPTKLFFFGFDEIYSSAAILGSDGGIGTTYNILGRLYVELDHAVKEGHIEHARELQDISQDFVEALLPIGVIPGVKAAMRAVGVDCGFARKPLIEKTDDAQGQMADWIARSTNKQWVGPA